MIHALEDVLTWLRGACKYDRVLYNALMNRQSPPGIAWWEADGVWAVDAATTSGRILWVKVRPHPVTGEPHYFYRFGGPDEDGVDEDTQTAPI